MITPQKQQYLEIASQYTESELAELLHVGQRTIRRYAKEFGIKPKVNQYANRTVDDWQKQFENEYAGRISLIGSLFRDKSGHIHGTCKCEKCGAIWTAQIQEKLRIKSGCNVCDKGNWGENFTQTDVESVLSKQCGDQWQIVKYGHYSKKDSTLKCKFCGNIQTVKLAEFTHATTMRCTQCQTGSFGECVIATTLLFNKIPFKKEFPIRIDSKRYRLDFLIDNAIALEYSGEQHFTPGLFYNEEINRGVKEKEAWCINNGYRFVELKASRTMPRIIESLSRTINQPLNTPPGTFFRERNPDMRTVLSYMTTHSARQTAAYFNIPSTRIKKYVTLDGYKSISDWQSDNKI